MILAFLGVGFSMNIRLKTKKLCTELLVILEKSALKTSSSSSTGKENSVITDAVSTKKGWMGSVGFRNVRHSGAVEMAQWPFHRTEQTNFKNSDAWGGGYFKTQSSAVSRLTRRANRVCVDTSTRDDRASVFTGRRSIYLERAPFAPSLQCAGWTYLCTFMQRFPLDEEMSKLSCQEWPSI